MLVLVLKLHGAVGSCLAMKKESEQLAIDYAPSYRNFWGVVERQTWNYRLRHWSSFSCPSTHIKKWVCEERWLPCGVSGIVVRRSD